MKNPEKAKASIAAAYTSRPGIAQPLKVAPPEPPKDEGLELSEVYEKPLGWFKLNPANDIFRPLKGEAYWRDLERDIAEAGKVLTPALAMPAGLLLEGESRLIVSQKLGLARMPVQIVLSPMSPAEQEKRLLLGNLSRFEVDEDTRILLYAKIWPGYFAAPVGATVAPENSPSAIAVQTGRSKRTVIDGKHLVQEATAKAEGEGRAPTVEDVREARKSRNEARREKPSAAPENQVIVRVRLVVERLEKESLERDCESLQYAADLVKEALR